MLPEPSMSLLNQGKLSEGWCRGTSRGCVHAARISSTSALTIAQLLNSRAQFLWLLGIVERQCINQRKWLLLSRTLRNLVKARSAWLPAAGLGCSRDGASRAAGWSSARVTAISRLKDRWQRIHFAVPARSPSMNYSRTTMFSTKTCRGVGSGCSHLATTSCTYLAKAKGQSPIWRETQQV